MDCLRQNRPADVRLHKFLAECGVASRRKCEALLGAGRVTVNGQVADRPGVRVDPARDTVAVNGRPVRRPRRRYLALNKPPGYLCTSHDPEGRPTFHDLLPPPAPGERLFSVGRLDGDSEGLLLVTNDGDLAGRLIHPRHGIRKTYRVWVDRPLETIWLERFRRGIESEGERLAVVSIRRLRPPNRGVVYEVVLGEGRNRHIRRMFRAAHRTVRRLLRTRIGPLRLGDLRRGAWRELAASEVNRLRAAAGITGSD